MFTIDRLAKLDAIAAAVFSALRGGIIWLDEKYEGFLIDATYRVAAAKATAITKAEGKIDALVDAQTALEADFEEAKARLKAKYHLAVGVLEEERYAKADALRADLAEAAQQLVTADKDYDATVDAALAKLGWEVVK